MVWNIPVKNAREICTRIHWKHENPICWRLWISLWFYYLDIKNYHLKILVHNIDQELDLGCKIFIYYVCVSQYQSNFGLTSFAVDIHCSTRLHIHDRPCEFVKYGHSNEKERVLSYGKWYDKMWNLGTHGQQRQFGINLIEWGTLQIFETVLILC